MTADELYEQLVCIAMARQNTHKSLDWRGLAHYQEDIARRATSRYDAERTNMPCDDLLIQDGWIGRCKEPTSHDGPHHAICVGCDLRSEFTDMTWETD